MHPGPPTSGRQFATEPSSEFVELYCVYRSIMREKGIEIRIVAEKWAQRQRQSLEAFGADLEFQLLCRKGCHPVSLAIASFAIEFLPISAMVFRKTYGKPGERLRRAREFEATAAMMERTLLGPDGSSAEVDRFWPKKQSSALPGQAPGAMIKDLRKYAKMYEFLDVLSRNCGIKSDQDLPRFVITSYVHLATGHWFDREVSAIIQAKNRDTYDEMAHKMWRNRNFERLNEYYWMIGDILREVGLVLNLPD